MLCRHFWTLTDLQKLGGNWIWISQIFPQLFPVLTFIIEVEKFIMKTEQNFISLHGKHDGAVELMNDLKCNLRVALTILNTHKHVSIRHYISAYPYAQYCLVSDASETYGIGGYHGTYFAWQWPLHKVEKFLIELGLNSAWISDIAFLEFLAAIVTELLASLRIRGHKAYLLTDSVVAASWLRKLRTRRHDCELFQIAMVSRRFRLKYAILPVRIPGKDNVVADHLSRVPTNAIRVHGKILSVFDPDIDDTISALMTFYPSGKKHVSSVHTSPPSHRIGS